MVAAVENIATAQPLAVAKPKPRRAGKRPPAWNQWPLEHELAVKRMYLVQGYSPTDIASALKLPGRNPQSISNLIHRRGWQTQRRDEADGLRKSAEIASSAGASAEVQRVVDATAALAESASIAGLQRAMEATQSGHENAARDFRAWAGGARDLVNVARQARGLDARSESADTRGMTLNLFAVQGDIRVGADRAADQQGVRSVPAEPIDVTPVQSQVASESKTVSNELRVVETA